MSRTLTKDWEKPKRWHRQEKASQDLKDMVGNGPVYAGRVLISMCDPFDLEVPTEWRVRFWDLVVQTPSLTWLVLTKRIENCDQEKCDAMAGLSSCWPLDNVWLGVSVEDQPRAEERVPILCSIEASVRWVSYEPALGPVDIYRWLGGVNGVSWVVSGGESGFNHRKLDVDWIDSMNRQCRSAGVAHFVKQDSARFSGEQGRIPNELWKVKQFPL